MKDIKNKERKSQAQNHQNVSLNNHSKSMEVSKKNCKERKKKYLKKKWNKRKNSEFTLVISINTTNLNSTYENKKKDISQIICYNCSKKGHFSQEYSKFKKDSNN